MKIRPARRVHGELSLPGDKSISHRAAILSALARGRSEITNFSTGEDCASTLRCLSQLGVRVERDGANVVIEGAGLQGLRRPTNPLDCGNSGSTMRMLAGVVAGQDFASTLTGDASLRSRPMRRIVEPLLMMGARVSSGEDWRAPLLIKGRRRLKGLTYEMSVASAQVKSCLLLAGLNAKGSTRVIEERGATRDHTERMLRWFGVPVESSEVAGREGGRPMAAVSVEGGRAFDAQSGVVPGDISSAAFFMAAAAMLPGSRLKINRVGLNPTRTRLLHVLRSLGVEIRLDSVKNEGDWFPEDFNEPYGDVRVEGGPGLAPAPGASNVIGGSQIAQLIDEIPVLAVLGSQVLGGISIRDAGELRVKESDRIRACVLNLRAMGAEVEEHEDGLTIPRRTRLRGAKLDAYGDHRIAMAFAVAALIAEGESELAGAECAAVSFPEFFGMLDSVTER